MELPARDVSDWGPCLSAAIALLACGLLTACGDGSDSPNGGGQDPGLLHVCRDGAISSYRIDEGSGRLTLTGTRAIAGAASIAAAPNGRHLFAAMDTDKDGNGGGIASFEIDRSTGTLSHVADAAPPPCVMTWWDSSPKCRWLWLEAGENRLVSTWLNNTYHDAYYGYVSYAFDADGKLGEQTFEDFGEWDPGAARADARARLYYKAGELEPFEAPDPSTLAAFSIGSDGRLAHTASTRSCGASTVSTEWSGFQPIVAAGGLLLAKGYVEKKPMLCWYQGPSLAARDSYDLDASAGALLPAAGAAPALAALVASGDDPAELRVMALTGDGRFEPRFSLPAPPSPVATETIGSVLFHPEGRLLFAFGTKGTVFVFALETSSGRLVWTERSPAGTAPVTGRLHGPSRMAVTR